MSQRFPGRDVMLESLVSPLCKGAVSCKVGRVTGINPNYQYTDALDISRKGKKMKTKLIFAWS